MLHKRKRSANILSSPTSTSKSSPPPSAGAGVQSFYPHTKPTTCTSPFATSKPLSFDVNDTPSHLNIRTRKRHRDNRPEAAAVHGPSSSPSPPPAAACWLGAVIQMSALADVCRVAASTIQRLYQAQQRAASVEPPPQPTQQQNAHEQQHDQHEPTPMQQAPTQKSTLHSFWHISQPVPSAVTQLPLSAAPEEARCEDCDFPLLPPDAMEIDDSAIEDKACASCRRPVCDGCAVIGRERVCGGCAGCERGW